MKTFKYIDWLVSLTLIAGSLVFILFRPDNFLYGYVIVGGWQVISMLVHECAGWFVQNKRARRPYHVIVLSLILVVLVCFVLAGIGYIVLLLLGFFLLGFAPLMAIIYTKLCYDEWKGLVRRPLSVLK